MTREQALKLRKVLESLSANISEDDALEAKAFFPHYEVGKAYAAGERFTYGDKLYKVVGTGHTSQADWVPGSAPALYTEIAPPDTIDVWKKPTGAHDAYQVGARVHYPTKTDPVYESIIPNNAWSPDEFPRGWEVVE